MRAAVKISLVLLAVVVVLAMVLLATFIHNPNYSTLVSMGPQQSMVIRNVRVFTATGGMSASGEPTVEVEARGFSRDVAEYLDGCDGTGAPGYRPPSTPVSGPVRRRSAARLRAKVAS